MPEKKRNKSNLISPVDISCPCKLDKLDDWVAAEVDAIQCASIATVVRTVLGNLDDFVRWPQRAQLLWNGCCRIDKYHKYPHQIREQAKLSSFALDGRVNGPAIASFKFAGGQRPKRYGSRNEWSVHHIYSGKFIYPEKASTLHAAYDGRHATQSAGLVAIHPIADQMCDEFPFVAWYLRALSFEKFGYDPDGVFANERDDFGFANGRSCEIVV